MNISKDVKKARRSNQRRKAWQKIVQTMAMIVVFCTTYALILPAITMEPDPICGIEYHVHVDTCYKWEIPECTIPEGEEHSHAEDPTEPEKILTCQIPVHVHEQGCYPETLVSQANEEEPEATEVKETKPAETNPVETEPEASEPVETEPQESEPVETEPAETEPQESEPVETEPVETEPGETEPVETEPGETEPEETEPGETEPGETEPEETEPGETEPGETEPEETEPGETEPEETEPEETEPEETEPEETEPEETEPEETEPEETEPEETEPEETEPEETAELTQTNVMEDGTRIQVQLPEDTTVPAGGTLMVSDLGNMNAFSTRYDPMEDIRQVLPEAETLISLLDISFYDEEYEYIKVTDTSKVTIRYETELPEDDRIRVIHFADEGAVVLDDITITRTVEEELPITELSFTTDGFSIFAVVDIGGEIENVTTEPVTGLSGAYYIVRTHTDNKLYAMGTTAATAYGDSGLNGLSISAGASNAADLSSRVAWTFHPVDAANGIYRISTMVDGQRKYLQMVYSNNNKAHLYLVDEAGASDFTVAKAPQNANCIVISAVSNNRTFYINPFGGISLATSFNGWYESHGGSELNLYAYVGMGINDLDGKTYAIVKTTGDTTAKALTAESTPVNGVDGLASLDVTMTTTGGSRYVVGDPPVWTFHAVEGQPASYYVSTEVNGETKYLRLLANNLGDGRGSLTLDTQANATVIQVMSDSNGGIYMTVADGTEARYINSDQSNSGHFWVYKQRPNNGSSNLLLAELKATTALIFELNRPSGSWYNTKTPTADGSQNITAEGVAIQGVANANAVGTYDLITCSGRSANSTWCANQNANNPNLTPENYLTPGRQYRFVGWKVTVDGVTHIFEPGTIATLTDSGVISMMDSQGVTVELPPDTTLTGEWEVINELVIFFVNFGDTMLDTQDNESVVGTTANYYTAEIAIGHLYNPVNVGAGTNNNIILRSNDALIQGEMTPVYDPNNTGTQLVISGVKESVSGSFIRVSNYNQRQLESSVFKYLASNSSGTAIKLDGAKVDRSQFQQSDTGGNVNDYWKLYWYVQKEVDDEAWHIDGVLVARTQAMTVMKTFSGLSSDEADQVIANMQFPMYLMPSATIFDDYHTLSAGDSEEGIYTSNGRQGNANIFTWTLRSILGQQYAFKETNYDLAGYDSSSLVSVHYTDGTTAYQYSTDSTFHQTGESGDDLVGTDYFAANPIIGGKVNSVIFANFYTQEGTGMFTISKVEEGNTTNRLSGAEFTLTSVRGGNNPVTLTTNVNGSVHFDNLAPGTYLLRETKAPDGYKVSDKSWTVTVSEDSDDNVTVTISDGTTTKTVYDSGDGGIKDVYQITNEPADETLTLTKTFEGIETNHLNQILNNSHEDGSNPYHINLYQQQRNGNYTLHSTLYLADAERVVGSNSFRWQLQNVPVGEYILTEYNFRHPNYQETVVSAFNQVNTDVDKDDTNLTASVHFTASTGMDTITITNRYTDEFQLKIRKVDANTAAALQGAKFKIYCLDPREANYQETITYTDDNGVRRTAYLVGYTTVSDSNGYAVIDGLKLSSDDLTYIYVFDEFETPNGYVKLDEPIISEVKVGTDGYSNGVFNLEVENVKAELATVEVTVDTVWVDSEGRNLPDTTVTLYKVINGQVSIVETTTLTAGENWTKTWTGLPYVDDDGNKYQYYASQEVVPAYYLSYGSQTITLSDGTRQIDAAIAEGYERNRTVTVINTPGYELPETGGIGNRWMQPLGLMLMLTFGGLYWLGTIEKKKQRGRR